MMLSGFPGFVSIDDRRRKLTPFARVQRSVFVYEPDKLPEPNSVDCDSPAHRQRVSRRSSASAKASNAITNTMINPTNARLSAVL